MREKAPLPERESLRNADSGVPGVVGWLLNGADAENCVLGQ